MRSWLVAALWLGSAGATWGAPRIDCAVGEILDTEAEIVLVSTELGVLAVSRDGLAGTVNVGSFCEDFEGAVAYVVPAPRDFKPVPEGPGPRAPDEGEVVGLAHGVGGLVVPRVRIGSGTSLPPSRTGRPSHGDEPAPSPARPRARALAQGAGCGVRPGAGATPGAALLVMVLLLGLGRRRGAR